MNTDRKTLNADVLVVDDVEAIRTFLRMLLIKMGFRCVDTASNSQQVMDMLRKKSYDLVFLDINLPGADGLSILRWIASKYPDIEVVMCTGNSSSQNVKEAMEYGAKGFLTKPVVIQSFMNSLQKLQYDCSEFQ